MEAVGIQSVRRLIAGWIFAITLVTATMPPNLAAVRDDDGHPDTATRVSQSLDELTERIRELRFVETRAFMRFRIASYLFQGGFEQLADSAEAICLESLQDLRAHEKEPGLNTHYERSRLIALLRSYRPTRAGEFEARPSETREPDDPFTLAYLMLASNEPTSAAVELFRQSILTTSHSGLSMLGFLSNLRKRSPSECLSLLEDLVGAAERAPQAFSTVNLYMLERMYRKGDVPDELRHRFLFVILRRAEEAVAGDSTDAQLAFSLLSLAVGRQDGLPERTQDRITRVRQLLSVRQTDSGYDLTEANRRIAESDDPLRQVLAEVNRHSDKPFARYLRMSGADIALKAGDIKVALDLASAVDSDEPKAPWRNDFYLEVLEQTLKNGDSQTAAQVQSLIELPRVRVTALLKLSRHELENEDIVAARSWLSEAIKYAESMEGPLQGSRALFEVALMLPEVDPALTRELVASAVRRANREPLFSDSNEAPQLRKEYTASVMAVMWYVPAAFRALAAEDFLGARSLAESFESRDLQSAAHWGMLVRMLDELKASRQSVPNRPH